MKRIILIAMAFGLVGCAGGQHYRVDNPDGTYYKVSDVGHTNMARTGAQYSRFELCDPNATPAPGPGMPDANGCRVVAQETTLNPSLVQQFGGAASTVIAAELLRKGIEEGGDTVNASAEGGDGGNGTAAAGSWSSSTSTATSKTWAGGCKGNCK